MGIDGIESLRQTQTTASTQTAAKEDSKATVKVAGSPKSDKTKGVTVDRTYQAVDVDGKLSDKEYAVLIKYGFSPEQIERFEWVGITGARVHTNPQTGQKELWLTSKENTGYCIQGKEGKPDKSGEYSAGIYRLEIPIDDNFKPSEINAYRAEDIYNVHFENVRGNLVFLEATKGVPEEFKQNRHQTPNLAFEGNSNVHVQGLDGAADSIKLVYPAVATFSTGDYADTIVTVSSKDTYKENHLKPGEHVYRNKAVGK